VEWLADLLFRFEVDAFVPQAYEVQECAPPRCVAQARGVYLEDASQAEGVLIKAVTYHQLQVKVGDGCTEVRVIFDI